MSTETKQKGKILSWIKRLLCFHTDLTFFRNVYGDEINLRNCRSIWFCNNCDKMVYKNELNPEKTNTDKQIVCAKSLQINKPL
jgi:hypothetical protein